MLQSRSRDIERLDEAIGKLPDTKFLVIDPINAYMGRVDTHRDAEIRRVLAPLTDLASRRRIGVGAVMHLKKGDASALHRISGSIGFVAAARIVWGFGTDPDTPENRVMVGIKNNLAPLGATDLPYRIEIATGDIPKIVWQQGAVTLDANAVLSVERGEQAERGERRSESRIVADEFALAAGEEMPVPRIIEAARAVDFSWRTVERVKKQCSVRSVKRNGVWCWVLA